MAADEPHDDRTQTHIVLTKGTMVLHYRIIEKIGAGGMGAVYLAEDTKLNRKVALKFLPPHLCQDDDCRERFKREAQAAARLNHPNIVHIYEVAKHNARPFFAMEHVEGQSLRDLSKGKELGLDRIIELAIQICDGLSAAHDKKIVHRDIKPSNIVIDAYGRPKILDFGLAAIQGGEHLTKTGSTLGTIGYMSPEQVQGQEADHRSDLFSLGVVLYELIAGRTPFEKDNEAATLKAITQDNPEPLARYKSDIPDELQRTVSKLLEKDPSHRYQHADGVVSDLKRLIAPTQSSIAALPSPRANRWPLWAGITAVAAVAIIAAYSFWPKPTSTDSGEKSLVVLPFENLGSSEDSYFADGMTDEITARLAGIRGLRVTSRTSAMQYRDTNKPIKVIGKELDVDYILEGTIRWDKSGDINRVRIIPQLIRISDDSHIWANTFERALTQVFEVQSDIATQISEALGITLLEPERQRLGESPTENLEAYHFYLRGVRYWEEDSNTLRAVEMLERAVEHDPGFYQAHRLLAQLYGYIHINETRGVDNVVERALRAAESTVQLAPGSPEAYTAMGYYHYYCSRDYESALSEFEKALQVRPHNSDVLSAVAYVQRRQGRWEEALQNQQEALKLDPRNIQSITGVARTLFYMHRLDEAEALIDDVLDWAPENQTARIWKVMLVVLSESDSPTIAAALNEFERYAESPAFVYWSERVDWLRREYKSALSRRNTPGDYVLGDSSDFYLNRGGIYLSMGDDQLSRAHFDSARLLCEARQDFDIASWSDYCNLAVAYAGLGMAQEALAACQRAKELLPLTGDALSGFDVQRTLATVYTKIGDYDNAIDILDSLLYYPSRTQIESVRKLSTWDPLRDNPRFQALLEKYETKHE